MSKRKTIGVVIDTMDGFYQKELVKMIRYSANQRGFNIIFLSGQALRYKSMKDNQYNTVFKLLDSRQIDGVILVLNSLEVYYDLHAMTDITDQFLGKPIISLAIPIEGANAICLDNKQASKNVVEHMAGLHGYRKIAYVSGPMRHQEAKDRYDGFLEVLKKYGIEEHLFYEGDFLQGTGSMAVDYFMKDEDNRPEAIICANDVMAAGVFLRLSEKGFKIPDEVAICGFDNLEISTAFYPSFTTVTQPIDQICDIAMSQFEKIFSGIEVNAITYVTSEMVIRESCGCFNSVVNGEDENIKREKGTKRSRIFAADAFEEEFMKNKDFIMPTLMNQLSLPKNIKGEFYKRILRLLDLLMEDLHSNNNCFNDGYYNLLVFGISTHRVYGSWTGFITRLREHALKITNDCEVRQQLEDIFYKSITLTGNQLVRKEVNIQFNFRMNYLMSRSAIERINAVKKIEELYDIMYEILPDYGLSQCYICLYNEPVMNLHDHVFKIPKDALAGFMYHNGIRQEGVDFKTRDILPLPYIQQQDRYDFICMALFNDDQQYGYMVASLDSVDILLYETLREQISNTIRNTILFKNQLEVEKALKLSNQKLMLLSHLDELTGLLNRRGFYQQIENLIKEASATKDLFTLLFCDIDKLKEINDTYGHQSGDEAIITTASIFKKVIEKGDIVARMSGDEFIVILHNLSQKVDILEKIASIKKVFASESKAAKLAYSLNVSIGYCAFEPSLHKSVDDLIAVADKRMYEDKAYSSR